MNYISKPKQKAEIKSFVKRNTAKDYSKPTRVKNVDGAGKKARKVKIQSDLKTTSSNR